MHLVCQTLDLPPRLRFLPRCLSSCWFLISKAVRLLLRLSGTRIPCLAVWVALRFRWWWVIPIAALGAWNKESFLFFLPALFPFFRQRSSRLGAWLAISVLGLMCLAVYYPIHLRFAHNPGGALEVHWRDQLNYFMHVRDFVLGTEMTYGVPMLKAFTLVPLTLLAWTVSRSWQSLPGVIQRHSQIAAAINIPLYLLFCSPASCAT